jgi:hypothetical protein
MNLSRRSFIASMVGALAVPRLALPAPLPGTIEMVPPLIVAFRESHNVSVISVRTRVVVWGSAAQAALAASPHLWSAVMVERRLA